MADRKNVIDDEDVAQIVNEDIRLFDNGVVDLCYVWNLIELISSYQIHCYDP